MNEWITDRSPEGNGTYAITVEQHKHDKWTGKDTRSRFTAIAKVEVYDEDYVLWTFEDDEGKLWESWDGHMNIETNRFTETYEITAWQAFFLPKPYVKEG